MSSDLQQYLAQQIDKLLRSRRIVVFYDPRNEFTPFLETLEIVGEGLGGLPRVFVHGTLCHVARYQDSFFALRAMIESVVSVDRPEYLLIYVPGVARNPAGSVLMDLELGGACYEQSLRRVARIVLRQKYTDGEIDEFLKVESLTYQDVENFLDQSEFGSGSVLKLVLGNGSSETLISKWLALDEHDDALVEKGAQAELYKLVRARLGLPLAADATLTKARHLVARYILVNEFRADLSAAPPAGLDVVPTPANKDEYQRGENVVRDLRSRYAGAYIALADSVEKEFSLGEAAIEASTLGSIDTFRFEERRLLVHAALAVTAGEFDKARKVIDGRGRCFWLENGFLDRLAQWEACRLLAELAAHATEVRAQLVKMTGPASAWIKAYAAENGWYRVDRAHRALESWTSQMEEEPESALQQALEIVRSDCADLLERMSAAFTDALAASQWATPGVLQQANIYPEIVESRGGRTAYIFADAMRYEMGVDLVDRLQGAEEVVIQPAMCALPSITPIGMAALHPGASGCFSVVANKGGGLAAQIGADVLPDLAKRKAYMKAVRPDSCDLDLEDVLHKPTKALDKALGDAKLVVVRSQDIDKVGESAGAHLARQVMDTAVGNIARAVRKLARAGIENFVITSDHGHLFGPALPDDMIMDKPGGDTVELHRRCWAGHGGQTAAAAVRVSGAELGYQTDLDFIFPRGLAVFRSGGDLAYHHGGASLQELVIPVVSLRMPVSAEAEGTGSKVTIEGYPKVLTNRTFGLWLGRDLDMFQQDAIPMRVVLLEGGEEVGRAGMAVDAEFDRATATVYLKPGEKVSIAMMLSRDTSKKVRVVVQDPATDAVLQQSDEIEIGDLL